MGATSLFMFLILSLFMFLINLFRCEMQRCEMGAMRFKFTWRFKVSSDGGYVSADGGGVLNCYADGGYGGAV